MQEASPLRRGAPRTGLRLAAPRPALRPGGRAGGWIARRAGRISRLTLRILRVGTGARRTWLGPVAAEEP